MKTKFTNSNFNKTFNSLLAFCVVLLMSINAFAQVTATEDFENEATANATTSHTFSESGISFSTDLTFQKFVTTFGYNNSTSYIQVNGNTVTKTITIQNASTSFKINSFAGYVATATNGNGATNGAITFVGTLVGGSTVTATVNVASTGSVPSGQTREANLMVNGLNFVGTPLDGVYMTSLSVSTSATVLYAQLDHISFTTQAVVTNQFSISDVSQNEGNSGTSNFTFTVTRSSNAAASSVQVQSSNGTATSGSDYTSFPLTTVNFTAGSALTQTVNVTVNGDVSVEPNETFTMTLSNPSGGVLLDATGTGTIVDDDAINEPFDDETHQTSTFTQSGNAFQTTGKLLVKNAGNFGQGGTSGYASSTEPFAVGNQGSLQITSPGKSFNVISVDLWSAAVSGSAPNWTFTPTSGTITFTGTKADGSGTVTHTAAITPSGTNVHSTVLFAGSPFDGIQLSAISFSTPTGIQYLQIDNFKYGTTTLTNTQLSIDDVSVVEGTGAGNTTATFTVTRTNNTTAFSVDLASSNGTATAGTDYTAYPSTTLNFTSGGALTQTVNVTILKDASIEPDETFLMTLTNATNGTVFLKQVGTGTIQNDDSVVETFEDETHLATTFSQSGVSFSTTGGYAVRQASTFGSGSSTFYLTSSNNAVGNQGTFSITSANKAFKLNFLDAWVGTSATAHSSGSVTFTGTLLGGGTVTTTKTITATSATGAGWQQNISFVGTPLENATLTAIQVTTAGALTECDIDNFNYTVVNTLPIIEVTDASNNAITNGGAAVTANNTDFGGACVTAGTVSKTYTIKNSGNSNLTLSGSPLAVLGGADAGQFSITTQPTSPITAVGSVTFTVQFDPSSAGAKNATITLTNNDATNSPYVINIKGTGNANPIATITPTPNPVCQNGTLSLSAATGATTYLWSGNGIVLANSNTTTAVPTSTGAQTYGLTMTSSAGCTATATTSVTVNAAPSATITPTPTAVCVNGTVNLSAPAGATTYLWSGNGIVLANSNTTTAVPTASGTQIYSLTATDAAGCSASATTSITVNAPPTASPSSNTPVCVGNTLNLTSTTATSYSWTGPNSFTSSVQNPSVSNVSIVAGGTYTLTVTNASGCTASATTSVTINTLPIPTASSNTPVCQNGTLNLTGGGTGTYSWTGPNSFTSSVQSPSISSVTNAAAGTYTLTVTNGGCSASATTAVVINPSATVTATPSTQTICSGSPITTIAITGTGSSYSWTRDNTTAVTGIAASGSGDISGSLTNTTNAPVTVTFNITSTGTCNGTTTTATVIVNPIPTATASTPSQNVCSGAAIAGINFNTPPSSQPPLSDPSSDNILTVKEKTTQGIAFSSAVVGTVFNWTRDNVGTVGGTIPASGSGNISGNFTNPTSSPITVTFTVTPSYTNAGTLCTGTPITVTVTVSHVLLATISDTGTSLCGNGSTTLSGPADPNYTYVWQRSMTGITNSFTAFGGTGQTQVVTTPGVYRLILTNQFNCSATDTTAVKIGDFLFNGSLSAGDAIQTGRMNRFAVASSCAAPTAYPGNFTTTGSRLYDSYTITNPRNVPVCATIGVTSNCGNNIFSAAYSGSFDPASVSTNYLADHGSSLAGTSFYEVTIPANGTIVVVVHEVNPGAGCTSYSLRVDVPREAAGITVSPNSSVCAGTPVALTASTANTYLWNPGNATTQTINPSPTANTTYSVTLGYGNGTCSTTATTEITTNTGATVSSNSPVCSGNTLNLTAGTATSYSWTGPNSFSSTVQNPSILNVSSTANGTYTLVSVNGGCSTTATTSVTINTSPIPNPSSNSPKCVGTTLSLNSAAGMTSYAWSGPNSFTSSIQAPSISNVTSAASGTYTLTVTNASGCSASATTAVTINQALPPTITPPTSLSVCSPSTLTLTASGCAGIVTWSQGAATGSSLTLNAVGTYSVSATCSVNGCTSDASAAVTGLEIKAKPNAPTIIPPTTLVVCSPSTLTLTASGCAGIVTWSQGAATGSSLTISMVGSYSVSATCTVNGCTSDASAAVAGLEIKAKPNAPTITPPTSLSVCSPSTLTLTASGCAGIVTWSQGAATGSSLTLNAVGTYSVSATCSVNGCTSDASAAVTGLEIKAKPNAPTIIPPTTLVVCSPSTLTLTASGCAGIVTWSQGAATGSSLTISMVGSYSVSATCTVNGCTSDASAAVAGLEIKAKPNAPTITPPTSLSVCSPSTLTLTASGCAGIVTWSQGAATGSSLTISMVGSYSVSATCTVNGCTSDASAAVAGLEIKAKPNAPTITPPTSLSVCSPSTLTLTASGCAGIVTWSQGAATGSSLTISMVGSYSVSATCTVNGCTSDASSSITGLEIKAKPNAPIITPPTSLSVCSPSTLTLTASGCAGTVTWSQGAATGSSLTLSMVGTYSVSATCSVNGCTSDASAAVTGLEIKAKPNAPTIIPPTTLVVCSPSTLTLTASGCAGIVTWSQGAATGSSLTISMVGSYSVSATCTVNGCTSDASAAVAGLEIKAKPNAPTITPPTSLSVCSPSTLTLTASGCAGIVTWSQGAATGSSLTISMVGSYSVSATCTVNGCTSDASAAVAGLEIKAKPNAPTITPPTSLSVCSPSTLTLTASGCAGIVTWSQGAATGSSLTISMVGSYSVSATCTVNGCTSDASSSITGLEIKAKPNAPIITPPTSLSVCSPSTLTLTASGCAGTVTWSQGAATGSSLTLSMVGTYSISATCTVNGCTSDASAAVTGLEIKAKPNAPTIIPPTSLSVCSPSTLTLIASGCAGMITWSEGAATGSSLTISMVGTYSVSATCTVNGCTSDASSAVSGLEIKATPTITATNTGPYTVGQTISLTGTGGGTYNWTGPNNFSSTLSNPTVSNALSVNGGIYTLSVTGGNGCNAVATTNVIVSGIDPCDPSRIVDYSYVQAGNPYQPLFPLTNGMIINQRTDQVSILVNPVCPSVIIESFEMNLQGPEMNWNILQNVSPYALFDNLGNDVWGRNLKPGVYTLTVTGYTQDNKGGGVAYGPKIITFTVVGDLATINAPNLSKTVICAGSSVDVSFTTTGSFNGVNQFQVELSDSSGSFAAPVLIGTTNTTGTLNCTIPQSTFEGSKYLIRVTSTNQIVVSNPAMSLVTVHPFSYNLVSPTNNLTGTNTKKAVSTINANNKITSPANVTYQAGNSILLTPGFESGAVFKAEIQGCNN